jgi:hypothetical protein
VATLWPRAALPLAMQLARLQRLQLPPAEHALRLASELRHAGVALLVLCVWVAVERRWGSAPRRVALRTAALVLATLLPATLDPQIRVCRQADAASRYGRPVGEWLATALPPGSLVATNAAGSIPYWSRLPVLDMLGLTDRHLARSRSDVHSWIGHERGDAAYVLQRRPAIVIWGGPEGSPEPGPFPGDHQLAASAEFHAAYEIERVPLAAFDFTYWRRRDRDSTPSAPGL